MERRSSISLTIALLLLASLASAAANPPDGACRNVQSLLDRNDWKGARIAAEEALSRFGSDVEIAARLRVLRAEALLSPDMKLAYESALPELPPSLAGSETDVKRHWILGIGGAFALNKDRKEVRAEMEAARRLAAEHHPRLLALILLPRVSMTSVYDAAERQEAAREALRAAGRFHQSDKEARVHTGMAFDMARQERYDEAIGLGEKALAWAKANHDEALEQQVAGNLGWCYYQLGDDELAEQHLRDALGIATRLGASFDFVTWYLQLGNIASDRDDDPAANALYQQALAVAEQPRKRGEALADLARVAIRTGNYAQARRYNTEALAMKRKAKDDEGVLRSRIVDAKIDFDLKHYDQARSALESVLAEAKLKTIQWRAHTALAQVDVEEKHAQGAEQHFREALAILGDLRGDIQSDERRLAFGHIAAELYDGYVDFLVTQDRSRDAWRIAELSRARTLAEGLNVDRDRNDAFDPEAVARRGQTTVLSYWIAPDRSFLFVATAEGAKHFVLPAEREINAAVDAYQNELTSGRATLESSRRGAELYAMLVAPAAALIRGTRITVIPDGRMAGFNFETLVVPSPKKHYWIDDVTIENASALQFVSAPRQASRAGKLLLIGNAPQADPTYPPLPHAAEEIAGIERYFERRTTLAGPRATPTAYKKAAPESYAFIHFVAHGVATRQRPLDSAVILGRDRDGGYKLYARTVIDRPLKARLVTISSCHGAGRRAFAGEGLVGLAWAFLRAGAHEVVAALWEVNDASTVKLMDHMYSAIHDGQPPADALRAAKRRLLHSSGIWSKPQYWAPFVLYSGS